MNILLTGARGFIGRHTLLALLEAGHKVRPLDRKPDPSMASGGIWYDITDWGRLEIVFDTNDACGAIIHLAANASLQRSIEAPAFDADQNVIGTLNVLDLAMKYGAKRFVFASTSAVYAPSVGPYHEDFEIGPQSPYGVSKAAGEMYVRQSGLPYAILRYANVYGPGQRAMGENALVARALDHLCFGTPFVVNGDGEQTRDWIHVKDVARANVLAATTDFSATMNIGTGFEHSVNEILSTLATALDRAPWSPEHGPAKDGELRRVSLSPKRAARDMGFQAVIGIVTGLGETAVGWASR